MAFTIYGPFDVKWFSKASVVLLVALVCGSFLAATHAAAQNSPEFMEVYGRGVHEYFANHTTKAERLFTEVINAGSTDPRVYYFRAMARMRLRRQYEAENDMRMGAAYEARDPGNQHSIGIALQRIQGDQRRTLERFRREARLDRVKQRRLQTQQRYEQLEERGPNVLRREEPVRLEQLIEPALDLNAPAVDPAPDVRQPPQPAVPTETAKPVQDEPTPTPAVEASPTPAADDDIFGDPAPSESPAAPATPAPDAADDPFGQPEPNSEQDPFGAEPAPTEDAAAPMTDEAESPEESGAEDSLFGDPATTPPAEEAPATEAPADAAADVFGDAPTEETPPAAEYTESAEPADAADPFSDAPPAEEPAESSSEDTESEPTGDLFGEPTEDSADSTPTPEAEGDPFTEEPAAEGESETTEESETPEETPADEDDLFGVATPRTRTQFTARNVAASSKVQPEKLLDILGRVARRAVPWRFPTVDNRTKLALETEDSRQPEKATLSGNFLK